MEEIYCNYKIQILRDKENYFLRYDGGQNVTLIKEIRITPVEVQRLLNITSVQESIDFLTKVSTKRWIEARAVPPSEYIGNTGILF